MSKAFDTIQFEVGEAALNWNGTDPTISRHLQSCWKAPRFFSIAGKVSKSIAPTVGAPQGDPTSPNVMAQVLSPWKNIVQKVAPSVQVWAFVDDRSGKSSCGEDNRRAMEATEAFDISVGLKQNKSKEQV